MDIMGNLVMEVTDCMAIKQAKIEINKINVVGGVNGSGKSTLSRIFYSFLKGNSTKRREYALQNILDDINVIIDGINNENNDYKLLNLSINDNDAHIQKNIRKIIEIHEKHCKMAKIKLAEMNNEMKSLINKIIHMLEENNYCNREELTIIYESKKKEGILTIYDDEFLSFYPKDIIDDIKEYRNLLVWANIFSSIIGKISSHENPHEDLFLMAGHFLLSEELQEIWKEQSKFYNLEKQWDYFLNTIHNYFPTNYAIINSHLSSKMDRYFSDDNSDISRDAVEEILGKEKVLSNHDLVFLYGPTIYNFRFYIDLNGSKIDAYDYLFNNFIDSICYVDHASLKDLSNGIGFLHFEELIENLSNKINMDLNINQDVMDISEKIENTINGTFNNYPQHFARNKKRDNAIADDHVSSGIKQIGIIQSLLLNNKLKKDGYLIIDEPEVNLHPDWQFKFAEILVLLANDLNITIYLNSHSPFFIEAIDAFTEFYDMQDDINYYLTEESEKKGKYNFIKIESDELYKIYENLGNSYDLINQLRLRKRLEK